MKQAIGLLHPGEMGISVGAAAQQNGHTVYWASAGRSEATRARAETQALIETESVADLCRRCTVIISVSPPHAAEAVAREVAACGFSGLYLDANAVSPEQTRAIGHIIEQAGGTFVDGGIVGGPAWKPGRTWLYLSGGQADAIAELFAKSPLETQILGPEVGQASALKLCYAAYTKGTTALLSAVLAAAQATGVRGALEAQWNRDDPGFSDQTAERVRRVTAKAWRFRGEMDEIAATFIGAELPGGFHQAAAEIYGRLAEFKDALETPELEDVLSALRKPT